MPSVQGSGGSTLIAHGVRVEGDFSSQGDVSIEGEVHGKVQVTGRLTVGSQALLKADVVAEQASIAGVVQGNISVKGHLELASTAKVTGDIVCKTAGVESGAMLNGKASIGMNAASGSPSSDKKEEKSS